MPPEKINGGTTGYAKFAATFKVLIELMLETGLRVSDAVKFDPLREIKVSLALLVPSA